MDRGCPMPTSARILAVGAHPDDAEFGCGGILAKEAARGSEVLMLILSRGEAGSSGTPEERAREAEAAAAILGARLRLLELEGDARLEYRPSNALAIARLVREWRANVLLAPSPEENQHPDHAKAGRLVRDAARLARYGGLPDLAPEPAHAVDALYYYDVTGLAAPPAGLGRVIVDVSPVFDTWRRAMESHASQMRTRGYVDLQVARARVLGAEIGTEYAMAVWANDPVRVEVLTDLRMTSRRY